MDAVACRVGPRLQLVILALALCHVGRPAYGGSAVSYATTIAKPDGSTEPLAFEGTVETGTLSGTIRVGELALRLSGVLAGETVSGTVRSLAGSPVATFEGKRQGDGMLRGTARLDGVDYPWAIPPSVSQQLTK